MHALQRRWDSLQLVGRYLAALVRYNLIDPLVNRDATRRFASAVLEFDFGRGVGRKLPSVSLQSVFPELAGREWVTVGGPAPAETPYLCGGIAALGATRVLEIGTFEGSMTLQLAANVPPGGKVVTVDLDPASADDVAKDISDYDRGLTHKARERIGRKFRNTAWEGRITQLLGDSAALDYREHFDQIDLAYIDGGHSYPQVKADTEAILPLVRPGGAIFWHDYQPGCTGVTRYLHELGRELPLRHLKRTQLAVLRR